MFKSEHASAVEELFLGHDVFGSHVRHLRYRVLHEIKKERETGGSHRCRSLVRTGEAAQEQAANKADTVNFTTETTHTLHAHIRPPRKLGHRLCESRARGARRAVARCCLSAEDGKPVSRCRHFREAGNANPETRPVRGVVCEPLAGWCASVGTAFFCLFRSKIPRKVVEQLRRA